MAVSMSASKETITKQRAPVMPITSWRAMERLAEVLDIFLFNPVRVFGSGQYNAPTNKMHRMARAQGLILSKSWAFCCRVSVFFLVYEVIYCSFKESKSLHFLHFVFTEGRALVALHCEVLSFVCLIGRTMYFQGRSFFWLVGCEFREKFMRDFFFVCKSQSVWIKSFSPSVTLTSYVPSYRKM